MTITFTGKKKTANDVPGAKRETPAKKKFGGLKFTVSTDAIKNMAVKTLAAGGLVVPQKLPSAGPTTPMPEPDRALLGKLSNAFNRAARGMTPLQEAAHKGDNNILEALLRNGVDMMSRATPAQPARPRMPSPSLG